MYYFNDDVILEWEVFEIEFHFDLQLSVDVFLIRGFDIKNRLLFFLLIEDNEHKENLLLFSFDDQWFHEFLIESPVAHDKADLLRIACPILSRFAHEINRFSHEFHQILNNAKQRRKQLVKHFIEET